METSKEVNQLKPCPFCDGKASIAEHSISHRIDGTFTVSYRVGCDKCEIYFHRKSEFKLVDGQPKFATNGYELATAAWNERAIDGTD